MSDAAETVGGAFDYSWIGDLLGKGLDYYSAKKQAKADAKLAAAQLNADAKLAAAQATAASNDYKAATATAALLEAGKTNAGNRTTTYLLVGGGVLVAGLLTVAMLKK